MDLRVFRQVQKEGMFACESERAIDQHSAESSVMNDDSICIVCLFAFPSLLLHHHCYFE